MSYQILISILPFLTSPYISRVLGAERLGVYSFTTLVAGYFGIFANLGIGYYGPRLIAKSRSDKQSLERGYSSLFILHTITTAAMCVAYAVFLLFFSGEYKLIFAIQGAGLLVSMIDVSWLFFGLENFKITVTRNAVIKLLGVASIFLFVRNANGLVVYTAIMTGVSVVNNIVLFALSRKYVKMVRVSVSEVFAHFKPLCVLLLSSLAVSLFSYMDRIMLGAMSSMEQLGYYENAYKLIYFPTTLITALGTIMLPKQSGLTVAADKAKANELLHKSMYYSMFLALPLLFGLSAVSELFTVKFWGGQFSPAAPLIMIMSFSVALMAFASVIRMQYLLPNGRDKAYTASIIAGGLTNLITNLILIPVCGAKGAAIATVIADLAIVLAQIYFVRGNLPVLRFVREAMPFAVMGGLMFCLIKLIDKLLPQTVPTLCIEIFAGLAFYAAAAVVFFEATKNAYYRQIKHDILRQPKKAK
jgi:O-antigen/teichoic acid export membrane protein